MKLLTNLNLSQNQLLNARLHLLASAPSSPVTGQVYYNSASNRTFTWNGTTWIDPQDRANHSGTQLAASISDLTTAVQNVITATPLSAHSAPTANVSFGSQRITNLADGVAGTDAATVNQLQAVQNGTDWKNSVRAATTANITLSGLQTIDGVTLLANDRVLVKDQTTASTNGLYSAQSGGWVRTTDADTSAEVTSQMSVMVEEGTTQAATQWRITTTGAIVLGTTALTFTQIGAGSSYVGGTGINVSGNTINIITTIVARRSEGLIGDGTSTSIAYTHSLGNRFVSVTLYDVGTNEILSADVVATSTTVATITFAVAPASNSVRVVVIG